MPAQQPIDDILAWSEQKLQAWQRDGLRRLSADGSLTETDQAELLAYVKTKVGLPVEVAPPEPVPFSKTHFAGVVAGGPLKLVGVRDVVNVNRLAASARLDFAGDGLTVVYGRNGSGKSGFVRILRTACRTRIEKPEKLKVLANVYGGNGGPLTAKIVVDQGGVVSEIDWKPDAPPTDRLLQVAVFDSAAASLYVDQGHQIRFLPFGLALPHKLNELCIDLKSKLDTEKRRVDQQLGLAVVTFEVDRETKSQIFYRMLSGKTGDPAIDAAASFSEQDEARLQTINGQLVADPGSSADLTALANWAQKLADDCTSLSASLSDTALNSLETLAQDARDKRQAASMGAGDVFKDQPLAGVGGGAWRVLWQAARNYSLVAAYPDREFPVLMVGDVAADCVLCQQPLGADGAARMKLFHDFIEGAVSTAAIAAETAAAAARETLPSLGSFAERDWVARLGQLATRNAELGTSVSAYKAAAESRRQRANDLFSAGASTPASELPQLVSPCASLSAFAEKLRADAEVRAKAGEDIERAKLSTEAAELADRKLLAANASVLKSRRDLLKQVAEYDAALKEVQTTAITTAANRFVDDHLSKKVIEHFDAERKILEIDHLKIELARKSDRTKAAFQTNPGTTITRNASEILSEGEQRALALSAFLTEVAMTDGSGPVVIDDPISSLDRERCVSVAARLAAEVKKRQVIVFTHDLVFFNDLCHEAERVGVELKALALMANKIEAGRVDPAGVMWRGSPVKKRLNLIKAELPKVKSLHSTSQADYEFQIKGLYGRLRDTYERVVEECIFKEVVTRGADRVQTLMLRYVHVPDALAVRFHEGMSQANTYSHDNPAAETVKIPEPAEFEADIVFLEALIGDFDAEHKATEARRPTMKK